MFSIKVLVVCAFITTGVLSVKNNPDDVQIVAKGLREMFHSGTKADYFIEAMKRVQFPHIFRELPSYAYDEDDNVQICYMCNLVADLLIGGRWLGLSKETIEAEVDYICISLGIENERVCKGAIAANVDIFLYIIDNKVGLHSDEFCGSVLQSYGCGKEDPNFEWSIQISEGISKERDLENSTAESIKILHLSDFHYDPLYKVNGNADCGEPICCQDDQGEPSSSENSCGYWTDYRNADSPWHLVVETVNQTNDGTIDYVYYTGDIISHRVWETSVANNTNDILRLYDHFKQNYEVPVFPIFGNHEPHPLNVWTTEGVEDETVSIQWLFNLASESWSELTGDESIKETIRRGGYYSTSPRPGFRVIGLNNNVCYTTNWWLVFDNVDPYGQLQWLADTLQKAEENNESVHILYHVPTGSSDCLATWSREYRRIIERYANTITGQFNGHTHKDGFNVFYNSTNPTQAINAVFNGASVTPYSNSNPSYKVYDVETDLFTLLDYQEWTFNLTLANSQPLEKPVWYELYSFVEAYRVNSLKPSEVDRVLYNMIEDHSLLDDYFRFSYRNGDAGLASGCGDDCRRYYFCEIAVTQYADNTQCFYFQNLYDESK